MRCSASSAEPVAANMTAYSRAAAAASGPPVGLQPARLAARPIAAAHTSRSAAECPSSTEVSQAGLALPEGDPAEDGGSKGEQRKRNRPSGGGIRNLEPGTRNPEDTMMAGSWRRREPGPGRGT